MREDWIGIKLGQFIPLKGNSLDPRKHLEQTFELFSVPSHETKKPEIVRGKEIGASKQLVENNWVLLSRINPHLNRCWVIKSLSERTKIASSEWVIFPPNGAFFPDYLGYYLVQSRIKNLMLANISGVGGSLTRTNKNAIREFDLALPPLPEQRAIVAKLEQLFSELDSGIAELKRAQGKLKVYRQAVLKKAFEGELTKEWREKQTDLPSAEELLQQIKRAREEHYQKQLDDWTVAVTKWEKNGREGKKQGKPRGKKEIEQLTEKEIDQLDSIPNYWVFSHLANAGELGRGKSKHRPRNDKILFGGSHPFIQTGDVKAVEEITEATQFYSEFGLAQSKIWPIGTLCITVAANIAETAFLAIEVCFPDSIVGFTPFPSTISKKYVGYFFQSAKHRISHWAPATAQKNINLTTLENLVLPFCSLEEQFEIVQTIESRLSVCNKMEESIATSLKKAEALRQSILKKAFEGRLLSEAELEACKKEKDWCPAGELLERVKETES